MALNVETFKTRALTALIFVAVMLGGLFWNFWSFLILFTLIHFGCWFEFIKLGKKIADKKYLMYSCWGLLYISLPIAMLLNLMGMGNDYISITQFGNIIPCGILFSIWINDTMAYLVGSFIGKTPFSKYRLKTWEGTLGGMLLCVVTIALLGYYIPIAKVIAVKHWIVIAFICAIFGTAGDLLESKLKRMANVKDSGAIMPGHGGFLDRFDSLLIAVPFVWLYVKLFL